MIVTSGNDPKIAAVVLAGGSGQRFDSSEPKQFYPIHGKPLLVYCLERFEAIPEISLVILVIQPEYEPRYQFIVKNYALKKVKKFVYSGIYRQESVWHGLIALSPAEWDLVIIHDGVRPFFEPSQVATLITAARQHGAATTGLMVTDTVVTVNHDFLWQTIDRGALRRIQTPQCFALPLIHAAHEQANRAGQKHYTDDATLVAAAGFSVKFVAGSAWNIKITTREDIILAQALLGETNTLMGGQERSSREINPDSRH